MTQNSFDSAITDALRNQWADYQRQNPNADPKAGDMAPIWTKWAESARKDIRRQVYQETLADLAAVNATGIRRRETDEQGNLKSTSIDAEGKPVDTPQDDDLFGEYEADMTGPAHEYAVIRQNLFERGQPMPSWEEFEQNRPGKLMAMIQGAFINSNLAWESGARSIGQWIGRTGVDLAMDDETVAQRIGVDYQDLKRALEPRYVSERFSLPYTPSEQDAELLGKYDQFMLDMYETRAKEEGDAWMRGARFASEVVSHDIVDVNRVAMMGSDPVNVQDIRDVYGRSQGGALVKGGEMVGSAMGIIPYSVPALASRNPRIAAMLTTPFYAMGHSGAWERRLEIYRDQVAAARANGEPEPARPTLSSLNEQARTAGFIEFGSEYTFDTAQKGLMGLLGFGTKVAGPGKLGANTIKTYANELANSMARRQGKLGAAKAGALIAAGGVVEGLEEAIPEAAKEITDPLYIPEGYENDFFSEETAEAVGTGFIAGFITTGTVAGVSAGARRTSRARAEEQALAKKAVGAAAGIVQQKADRLAAERLVQNSAQARGATMALHQIEEIGASDRRVMFVSGDVAEATITEDVKKRMEALGIPSKPIGIVHGLRVYAHADQAASVRQDIMDGNIGALTGHPAMKDPNLPAVGAIVVRNQSNQILEVLPYSSEADADSAQPAIQEIASRSGNIITRASASELPGLSETMAVQMDTDARMRKVARPSRRGPTRQDVARGVQALRLDIANATTRSKWTGSRNDAFETEYLTAEEVGGATNKDVEIDVTLRPVAETQLSDTERRITLASGGRPTIVDGSVRVTITRPDGSKQVFDKPIQQAGAYLAQSSPDGLYLIREKGSAFTARNAMALLLHELRHQLVGRSRAGAKLMAQMMYLDPVLAMRGGIQYMREYATESTTELDPSTNAKRILSDEELVGRYAAMHAAAESVLSDPDATAADRAAALEDRKTAEQFAEEMGAVQAEESTGQTLTAAAMWDPIYKNMKGMSARKFASWAGYHLAKAGWAGPWAKQALWELSQRQKGVSDAQLRIHDQMLREIEPKYREDMERNRQVLEGSRSQVMPAVGAALGAAAAPIVGAAGDDDDEIAAAGKALEGIGALPPEQKGEALSKIISALSAVVPTLASASASITGTGSAGRTGVQSGKRQAPEAQPQVGEVVAEPTAAPQPEARPTPMSSTERESMYRQRGEPMFAMRPQQQVEFFSALNKAIMDVPEESMSPQAWSNRIKSMVNKGQVKQTELDWTGFEDFLALPRGETKLSREFVADAAASFKLDVFDATPFTLTTEEVKPDVHGVIRGWEEALTDKLALESNIPLEDFDLPMEIRRDIKAVFDGELVPETEEKDAYWKFDSEAKERLDDLAVGLGLPRIRDEIADNVVLGGTNGEDAPPNYLSLTLPGGKNYRQTVMAIPDELLSGDPDGTTYENDHWPGLRNPIAHIRTKDRVSSDGRKVLFVEEMQSDWAQAGRKAGFRPKELPSLPEGTKYFEPGQLEVNAAVQIPRPVPGLGDRTLWYGVTLDDAKRYARQSLAKVGIPRAPFVESTDGWLNLTLKNVILDAINGGYDRVAFVNGKQSADRYRLSKRVQSIDYIDNTPMGQVRTGPYEIGVTDLNGESIKLPQSEFAQNELAGLVGEEIAEKIISGQGQAGGGRMTLRGVDLEVGGKGMIDFYDKIVPAAANKLLKRLGGGKATVIDAGTGAEQIGFDVTDAMRKSVTNAGGIAMFARRRDIEEKWAATSKAVDEGELTTVYVGNPTGLMEFDSQRMGRTSRPVSIGAATSSTTADGMWFTSSKSVASDAAGISSVNMLPQVSRILNAKTKRLAAELPQSVLRKFEENASQPLQDYVVSPENLADFMENDGDIYEGLVRGHAQYLSEMMDNDPAAVAKIDQAFQGTDIAVIAGDLAGSRGGVMRGAHLKLENPLIVPFKTEELRSTDRGVEREDEPFITQASDAIAKMRSMGNDGIIMKMPDGERRYFVRNPSQVQVIGAARDVREASMFAMRGKPMDPSNGVGRQLSKDAIRALGATEDEIKATVLDRMKGGSREDTYIPEKIGGISDIVRFLGTRRNASGLRKLDVMNPKHHMAIARLMVLEAVAHINATKGALEWYDSTVRSMLAQAAMIHPELKTDKNAQMVFSIGLAISSQGQNVEDNIAVALDLYDSYKASIDPATGIGQFGDDLTKGTKKASQNKNLKLANTMLREIGLEGMRTFLAKQYTVKELRALGYKPGGELVDEALLGSSVFGPKIGFGFLSNLMGNFDPITMDMWFMRTVLRLAGSLSKFNPKTYAKQRARFLNGVAQVRQEGDPAGIYASDIDPTLVARATSAKAKESSIRALARAVVKAHEKDFKNNRAAYDSEERQQTEMVLAAKTILGSLDKPRDVAKSGGERHNLRAIVRMAVAQTNEITGLKIPHAAFQALIWYPEQELFKSLGAKLRVTSQDYAGAMTKQLQQRGFSDAAIQAAIASSRPEPTGPGGPRGPRGTGVRPAAGAAARPVGRVADRQADGAVRPQDQGQSGDRGVESQFSMRRGLRGVRDEAALRYVDKFDELLRYTRVAEERGTTLAGLANPYTAARLLTDRLGAMQRGAERRYADLLRRQYEAGVTLGEMDEFLTAQHAEERNRYVASINPAFPDGGSGMMTSDANDILDDHRNNGRFDLLDGFANEWRAMLNEALVQRRDAGLVTRDLYDRLTTRYQRYVPLRGAPAQVGDEDFEAWGEPGGSGLSTTGRGVPRSMGRRSEAQGVTSQVAYVHEDAFRRIARNQVGQAFLSIVRAVGDRAMAEVIRPRRRVLVNGVVRNVHDMGWMQDPRNFGVYVDQNVTINGHDYEPGDLVVIRINNRRLADAMTSPTLQLRSFERALTNVNNVWRFMTTGMGNPAFAPVNMLRDVGQAVLNNLARRGFADTVGMMRRWPTAFMRVWMDNWINLEPDQMATPGGDRRLTGSYARFVEAGGDMVGWRGNDLEAKQTDFDALADRVARRDPNDRTLARTLLGWYSGFFAASETAARLAQFEQRVATGSSDYDAALAARDITVDFRKGGMAKPVLNTWYMFLNAGLQGTVNVAGAVARSLTLAPSLIMLGFAQAFMARTMGGDDEDTGQAKWDNIPQYEKTSNMYFFNPNRSGKYAKMPVPYGYNVFFSAGVRLEDVIYGRSTPADMVSGMLVDGLNAFNPIGGSGITGGTGNVLTSIMPTMVRPLGELAINEDFSGRPIYPRSYGKFPQPDSTMFFDGTPEAYISTADWLNKATGGDEFEAGALDMSPDTMEYLVGYYFSGTGRMLNRLYKVASSGGDVNPNDVPVLRSFVGDASTDTRAISQRYNQIGAELAPSMRRLEAMEDEDLPLETRRRAAMGVTATQQQLVESLKATDKALSEINRLLKGSEGKDRESLLETRRIYQKGLIRRKNELTDAIRALE